MRPTCENFLDVQPDKDKVVLSREQFKILCEDKVEITHLSIDEEFKKECEYEQKQAIKETAKKILITAIQLSDMCRDFYEFQNRLVDLIETNYGVEVERKQIIPTKQFGVEIKE